MKKTVWMMVLAMVTMVLGLVGCERAVEVYDDREPAIVNVEAGD